MKGSGVVIVVVVIIVIVVIAVVVKGGGSKPPVGGGPTVQAVSAIQSEISYEEAAGKLATFNTLSGPEQGALLAGLSNKKIKWQGTVVGASAQGVLVDMAPADGKPEVILYVASEGGPAPAVPAKGASITFTGVLTAAPGSMMSVQDARFE